MTDNQKCMSYILRLIIENTDLLKYKCTYDQACEDLYCLGYIYAILLEKETNL